MYFSNVNCNTVTLLLFSTLWSIGSHAHHNGHFGQPPYPEPEPYNPYETVFPGEAVIRHYPRGQSGSMGRSDNDPYLKNPGGRCGGVCIPPAHCNSLKGTPKGFCAPTGASPRVCCGFEKSCEESTSEISSSFFSPGYPGPTLGTLICQYDINLQPGVCAVRLEFKEFNTTDPLDRGLCNIDQFLIMNSLEGATFPRCGEMTGYSTIIAVDPRHRLPLTLLSIIQSSKEQYKWNVKFTQMKCDSVRRVADYPNCGKSFIETGNADATATDVPGTTPQYSDVENIIPETEKRTVIGKSYGLPSRLSVDNAFYITYLKQAHDAIVSSMTNTSTSNTTLCKNRVTEIETEKLLRLRNSGGGDEVEELARIIRGNEALLNEFPWQVSIQDSDEHICGGAIISPTSILTASHCFLSVAPVPLSRIQVAIGDLNLNSTTESEQEYVEISSIVFHSHFDPYYLENDVALIKLKTPIKFRSNVQPVCLPEGGNSYAGQKAVISGWGATSYPQGRLATNLQRASTEIIENSECKKKLKIDYVYSTMMCAVAGNCSGTCFGDSGGPLVVQKEGLSTVIGLVSFGIGGCSLFPFWPDVYTRVSEFLDWVAYAV